MIFADALKWIAIPFVLATIYFGLRKGENDYYDSDDYDGKWNSSLGVSLSSEQREIFVRRN